MNSYLNLSSHEYKHLLSCHVTLCLIDVLNTENIFRSLFSFLVLLICLFFNLFLSLITLIIKEQHYFLAVAVLTNTSTVLIDFRTHY